MSPVAAVGGTGQGPRYLYDLFSVRLSSAWRLPFAPVSSAYAPSWDVSLEDGTTSVHDGLFASAALLPRTRHSSWFERAALDDGGSYLRWGRSIEFLVTGDGARIIGRRGGRTGLELFEALMLGPALSYALVQQGLEPLHASVVSINGQGVAFLGPSGRGKSSLAAAFVQAGYHLVTDDQLVVTRQGTALMAHLGPPRIKLMRRMATRLRQGRPAGITMPLLAPKLAMPMVDGEQALTAVPLRAIYVIGEARRSEARAQAHAQVRIRHLPLRQACLALIANTFNGRVATAERLSRQFAFVTNLAGSIPVRRLSYPRRLPLLATVRDAVLSDLSTCPPCCN